MVSRRTLLCVGTIILAIALPGLAKGKTQVMKDRRGDHPACAPVCDMKSVTVNHLGKRIKFVVRFWGKRYAKMSHVFSWVDIKAGKNRYWAGNGVLIDQKTEEERKIRFKRRWGKQILVFPLKAIGDPKAFLWRANTGCCGISDYSPNRKMKKFRVGKSGPKPLPVRVIEFGGGKGSFTIDCPASKRCAGKLTITRNKADLIKPRRYSVGPGDEEKYILRLTKAGKKVVARKGSTKALGVLTATDGDKAKFTAILKRK